MKKLSDKWDDMIIEFNKIKKQKIEDFKTNNHIPECFYKPQIDKIITYNITDINVRVKGFIYYPRYYKKVTKHDLGILSNHIDDLKNCELEYLINYEYFVPIKITGAFLFNETILSEDGNYYNKSNDLYSSLEEAEKKHLELKEIYGKKEGYRPCEYCRKQVKIENLIHDKIYIRKSGWVEMDFCSTQCASYEQMSREG